MTVRGYRIVRSGPEASLQCVRASAPIIGPRQVLVRMAAASLNYRDLLVLQDPSSKDGLIPLSDGAGAVEAVGEAVTKWKVGDRVSPNFFPEWQEGKYKSAYLGNSLGGGQTDGVFNEFVVANEGALVKVADHLTFAEAATLPCAGLTAWHALMERSQLSPGDTVLVQGTGGVALLGLQIANAAGARVIVTSSSDEKLERATSLGAWRTINYRRQPAWDEVVLDITDGLGADRVLEVGGPDTYNRSINAVAAGGRIAQIGVLTGFDSRPSITALQFKNATVDGICVGSVEQFQRFQAFVAKHEIRPVIDVEYAYAELTQAYDRIKGAGHFGKVVVALP